MFVKADGRERSQLDESEELKVIPLSSLIKVDKALLETERALFAFKCDKNEDEENFLHKKAIDFEKRNKARTYLLYDSTFQKLYGYFTLSFKSIELQDVKKNQVKKMTAGENVETYAVFLIGHLAKNSKYNEIAGDKLLSIAETLILRAQKIIGGRLIYIDCKDIDQLKSFYMRNEYTYFNTSKKTGLLQYYKKI